MESRWPSRQTLTRLQRKAPSLPTHIAIVLFVDRHAGMMTGRIPSNVGVFDNVANFCHLSQPLRIIFEH